MVSRLKITLATLAVMPRTFPRDCEASVGSRSVISFSFVDRWYLFSRSPTQPCEVLSLAM